MPVTAVSSAPAAVLIPLGAAFLMPVIGRFFHHFRPFFSAIALILSGLVLLSMADPVLHGQTLVYWMSSWQPRDGLAIGISLSIDAWGWLIALIAVVIGLASVIYASGYMRGVTGHESYYVLIMLLVTGLIGFALSGDVFNQFVWLEVFSVAAFALTAFHTEQGDSIEAAFKYLITNSIAAFFIAIGLALLYMNTGALNLAHIARDFRPTPGGMIGVGLLIGGYVTKAALVPWHFWLPDAHATAPAPVSAVFSGALINIGIYAVARCILTILPPTHQNTLKSGMIVIGMISIGVGGIQMLHQRQIKRILAYSSVAQMGFVMLGIGIGTPMALAGAALHLLHHALVKAAMFMGIGGIVRQTGLHELDELGGLARNMPITFILACLAGLALAGLPFTSGYLGKSLIGHAAEDAGHGWLIVVVIALGMFSLGGLTRLLWRAFAGQHRTTAAGNAREAPAIMLITIAALLAGSLVIGLSAGRITSLIGVPVASALESRDLYIATVMGEKAPTESKSRHDSDHPIPDPVPTDLKDWAKSLISLIGGLLIAYLHLRKPYDPRSLQYKLVRQGRRVSLMLRRWHTGIVTDYALWNAMGTALLLLVAFNRR